MNRPGMSRRRFLTETALLLSAAAFPGAASAASSSAVSDSGSGWNLPGPAPHLMSHYMPWFAVTRPGDTTRIWQHWKWTDGGPSHDPEKRRADGLRDIASVYYPLIGPYSTWSRDVVRYHLGTAHAAGIQGFLVDWDASISDTDKRIPMLLDEADKLGMKIGLCYEEKINFVWPGFRNPKTRAEAIASAEADLKHITADYGGHPAFLRRHGVPYIFLFNGYGNGLIGPRYYTPAEWTQIHASLPRPILLGRQGLDSAFFPPFQASFQWWSSSAKALRGYYARASQMVADKTLLFYMAMISPGFNDTGVWGWGAGPRVTPRAGLSLLRSTLDLALASRPEIVQIVTWNDFNEGTVIEPTRETGFQYLDAIATWWGRSKGRPVDLDAIRAPFREYVRTCSPSERAELPENPDSYLARRSLAVSVPDYLDVLDARAGKTAAKG